MKEYILKLNETQAKAVMAACEEYFRLRLGQFGELADDLALMQDDNKWKNNKWKMGGTDFDRFIQRRNAGEEVLNTAYRIMCNRIDCQKSTKTSRCCEDVWQVIRYQFWQDKPAEDRKMWCVDANPPMQMSDEPLPKIERVEDAKG